MNKAFFIGLFHKATGEWAGQVTLPSLEDPNYGLFAEDQYGIAPSPNTIRVVDLENTLESEPNNARDQATQAVAPGALNGIIEEPGGPLLAVLVNTQPVANAGADQFVNEGSEVTLDGSGSSDPDGDLPGYDVPTRVAIDNFGTGPNALSVLTDVGADILKLDEILDETGTGN